MARKLSKVTTELLRGYLEWTEKHLANLPDARVERKCKTIKNDLEKFGFVAKEKQE